MFDIKRASFFLIRYLIAYVVVGVLLFNLSEWHYGSNQSFMSAGGGAILLYIFASPVIFLIVSLVYSLKQLKGSRLKYFLFTFLIPFILPLLYIGINVMSSIF